VPSCRYLPSSRAAKATPSAECKRSSSSATCPGDPSKGLQVDGIFGPKTDAAVRGFQQALHQDIPSVTVDGIVGPVTWRALVSGMLSF
jgi:peptidoglycan hydrolase-like protein with peptidoglycan-binding domain